MGPLCGFLPMCSGTPPGSTLQLSCTFIWFPPKVFRYSTETYLLLFRRVNSRLVPGTPPGSTSSIVYLAPNQAIAAFRSGGKISIGCWEKPFVMYLTLKYIFSTRFTRRILLFQRKILNKRIVPSRKAGLFWVQDMAVETYPGKPTTCSLMDIIV